MRLCGGFPNSISHVFFYLVIPLFLNLGSPKITLAFDVGHHFDQSRPILAAQGFSESAIRSALIANWLTDYYSNAPDHDQALKSSLELLHFDNLEGYPAVRRHFYWLMANTAKLTREAALKRDRIQFLAVMGMAMHAMQDFYSHANWVELFPRHQDGSFNTTLLHEVEFVDDLRTGTFPGFGPLAHGGNYSGLNQDTITRPRWMEAQAFAFLSTSWLVSQMKAWSDSVNPGFWRHVAQLKLAKIHERRLMLDRNSAIAISMWVTADLPRLPPIDGKWKGDLSGDPQRFVDAAVTFTARENSFITQYMRDSDIAERLVENMNSNQEPPPVEFHTSPSLATKVIVVTLDKNTNRRSDRRLNRVRADIKIDGKTYHGREVRLNADMSRQINLWREMHFHIGPTKTVRAEIRISGGFHNKDLETNEILEQSFLEIDLRENGPVTKVSSTRIGLNAGIDPALVSKSIEVIPLRTN